tara:strand:- start:14525 stop:14830 length:306 start_codon:yes stop_codon:yes gene_type:complete
MSEIISLLSNHPEVVLPFFLNALVSAVKKSVGVKSLKDIGLNRWVVPATMVLGVILVYAPYNGENFFFQDVPRGVLWIYGACMGFVSNGLYSFHKKTLLGR